MDFVRLAKPSKLKDGLTYWEKTHKLKKTEKANCWFHACGGKDFCEPNQFKIDTDICTLHFVGGKGPMEDRPNSILATLSEAEGEK